MVNSLIKSYQLTAVSNFFIGEERRPCRKNAGPFKSLPYFYKVITIPRENIRETHHRHQSCGQSSGY